MPSSYTPTEKEEASVPRYMSNKATQTDCKKSPMPIPRLLVHSTPTTPETPRLLRRRSLSVGSSPIQQINPDSKKSLRNLFSSTAPALNTGTKEDTPATVFSASAPGVIQASGVDVSSSTTAPKATGGSKDDSMIVYKSKKYSKKLVEICQEFDRQEQDAIAAHERNKRNQRYHLCPKLNFESSGNSEDEIQPSDTSCTSTCRCQHNQSTEDTIKSSVDNSNNQTTAESTFLHVTDETAVEAAAEPMDTAENARESTKQADTAENATESTKQASIAKKDVDKSTTAEKARGTKRHPSATSSASSSKAGKYPEEFQADYFTQIRNNRFPMSPRLRLVKHLENVNRSGNMSQLDVSLIPAGSTLVYSPPSNRVSVEDVPSEGDVGDVDVDVDRSGVKVGESDTHEEIKPAKFYTSKPE